MGLILTLTFFFKAEIMHLAGKCYSISCFNAISNFCDNFAAQKCQHVTFQLSVEKCVLNAECLCCSFIPGTALHEAVWPQTTSCISKTVPIKC